MSDSAPNELDAARKREAARIRAEYARRDHEVPADRYSLENPGHRFLDDSQNRAMIAALTRARALPLAGRRILEIGCGSGRWLRFFAHHGADPTRIFGVDLDTGRLAAARGPAVGRPEVGRPDVRQPDARIHAADASMLPFAGASFDLVLQSTVMTSILDDAVRQAVARDMLRVLRPRGVVLWYDFRVDNPRNPHVRGVPRRALRRLFPDCAIDARRTTLAPPLARLLAPRWPRLAALLDRGLLFATHDIAVIRRTR